MYTKKLREFGVMAKKIYVVRKGHKTGIFRDTPWEEVKTYYEGYPGAEQKSFTNMGDAHRYFLGEETNAVRKVNAVTKGTWNEETFDYSGLVIFTDGSCVSHGNAYSFGLVALLDGEVIHEDARRYDDKYKAQRSFSGELKGAVAAMLYAKENGHKKVRICYDYAGIEKFADGSWSAKAEIGQKYINTVKHISKDVDIHFIKVPAHSNVKYNERADTLAKEALADD